jgi:hypothetical protein
MSLVIVVHKRGNIRTHLTVREMAPPISWDASKISLANSVRDGKRKV